MPAETAELPDASDLLARARAEEDAYLATLTELVEHESPTVDKAACDALADTLEERLRDDGWRVERRARDEVGDILIGRRGDPHDGGGTLLLCHYDTVWPIGTLEEMPIRHEGNVWHGPGSCDMKAGIATALHAVRLADRAGLELRGPTTILLTSDEEDGSRRSRDLIEAEAQRHERVLVFEPSRDDGAIKVGRKGVGMFFVDIRGVGSHAGNNPHDGASALRELAHFLLFVEDLADDHRGTTVNLTVAQGGTVGNVIAERATAKVDVRVLEVEEGERLERAVPAYRPRDSRVQVVVTGGMNRPPLESTPANEALYDEAQRALRAMGVDLDGAVGGGGSDGNFTSALGVATLDGLGCSGVGPHSRHEHIRVAETLERLALVTALLTGIPGASDEPADAASDRDRPSP